MDDLLRLAEDPNAWAALATLIAMEVVLGLDNLVFIALLTNRIDERRRGLARKLGLSLALVFRLALLASASWWCVDGAAGHGARTRLFRARSPVAGGRPVPGLEGDDRDPPPRRSGSEAEDEKPAAPLGLISGLIQIIMIDIVFSVDSIITAVGMTEYFPVMVDSRHRGCRGDDGRRRAAGGVHPPKSDCLDARVELPPDDRHDADRRRFRLSYRKRLYLRRDVFFLSGRGAQRLGETQAQATNMTHQLSHPFRRCLFRRRGDARAGRRGVGRARARAGA